MLIRLLILSALFLSCQAPVLSAENPADDDDEEGSSTSTPAPKETNANTKSAKPSQKTTPKRKSNSGSGVKLSSVGHFAAAGSKRAAAVATGFSIGTPVAVVRLWMRADSEQAEAVPFIGESKKKPLIWISRAIVIPTSFFSGTVQAPIFSAMNAWSETEEKPFSKESFFFGDLESRVPQ